MIMNLIALGFLVSQYINDPTLAEFWFGVIRRVGVEESKSDAS